MLKRWMILFASIMYLTSPNSFATCDPLKLGLAIQKSEDMAGKILSARSSNHLETDLKTFTREEQVLDSLNRRKFSQPGPTVIEEVYTGHLRRALELSFSGFEGRLASSEEQAKQLIYGHPRLFGMMVKEVSQHSRLYPSTHIKKSYESFVEQVILTSMGDYDVAKGLQKGLREASTLSLVRITPQNQNSLSTDFSRMTEVNFLKLQTYTGTVGFSSQETTSIPYSHIAAVNPNLKEKLPSMIDGRITTVDELFIDDADADGKIAIAMAERLDILLNQSDRWESLKTDAEFLNTLNPGSEPVERSFVLDFFHADVAQDWMPPSGVKMESKVKTTVTVRLNRASQAIILDADLSIRSFSKR